jgi:hypothetical protein
VYTKWEVVFIIVIYYTYSKHTIRLVLEDWVKVRGFKCCSKPIVFLEMFTQTLLEYFYHCPKLKFFLAGQRFIFELRGDHSCRGVFYRSYEEPLQGRDNGAGASLE